MWCVYMYVQVYIEKRINRCKGLFFKFPRTRKDHKGHWYLCEKRLAPAPSIRSSLPGQQEEKQRNAILPVPLQWGRSSTKSPCVCQQDSEVGAGLSEKEVENKIKWGLIQKANVCWDKATAGIVISQIVLIWANSASETVTVVFMFSSPSWPYLASLALP